MSTERPRRCPRCNLINPPHALRCDCGFDFRATADEVEHELDKSSRADRSRLLFGGVVLGLSLSASVVLTIATGSIALFTFPVLVGGVMTTRALVRRSRTARTRAEIVGEPPALPVAVARVTPKGGSGSGSGDEPT